MLKRKLRRDIQSSFLQFVAMMLLCMLGTWVFSGLDSAWRLLDHSIETYFDQQNIPTFWVKTPNVNKEAYRYFKNLSDVSDLQERFEVVLETNLESEAKLKVYGYNEEIRIGMPKILEGERLLPSDVRGCLLEERFAVANGLSVGDSFRFEGYSMAFTIRGLVMMPEQILTSKDVGVADPLTYGFAIVNRDAFPALPVTEYLVKAEEGADEEMLKAELESYDPQAFVLGQDAIPAIVGARDEAVMFRNISYVFPLLAFAVAAMILLTTLTRMIENQRMQLGTLRSLGYADGKIAMHYLSYGLFPSVIGASFGIWFGRFLISKMIWEMEESNFTMPDPLPMPVSIPTWLIFGASILLSLLVCYHVYQKSAKETTASLLRPKPPKEGTRTFLERFPRLWDGFAFNRKMIIRNMFRNKLRTAMTLVGVLCCNMLMITTLGLQESVSTAVERYYDSVVRYDMSAELQSQNTLPLASYRGRIDAQVVDGEMALGVVLKSESETRNVSLYVQSDGQTTMNIGKDYTYMALPTTGIVLTEKLCTTLDVMVGETVSLRLPGDDEWMSIPVVAMSYSHLGQGAYMHQQAYEALRKGDFRPTALHIQGIGEKGYETLNDLEMLDEIKWPSELKAENMKFLDAVTNIFGLMGVGAFGLAFVICYNMGILNFFERTREYATLKVLGYHNKEIKKLMVNESNLIALLGIVLGIAPGLMLTKIILVMCESEQTVFPAAVSVKSILIASISTYLFSRFVQWILTRNVTKIDMVSSLKSVE